MDQVGALPATKLDAWRAYFALKREREDQAIERAKAGPQAPPAHVPFGSR